MAIEDYLQPSERIVATCGPVYATNQRLIHYMPRSKSMTFREYAYPQINGLKLVPKARLSTVVLGFIVAVLSLLAGPGSPFQIAVAALGVWAMGMGFFFGDQYLEVAGGVDTAAPVQWRLREVSRRDSREFVAAVRSAMAGSAEPVTIAATAVTTPGAVPRSVLVVPADSPSQVRSALSSAADVVCIDLADLVHPSHRETARLMVWGEVAAASRFSKGVWARIGVETTQEDLDACVWPGLTAIVASVDSAEGVRQLDASLAVLEGERHFKQPEQVGIVVALDTAAAVWAVRDTLAASPRVRAVVVGVYDLLPVPAQSESESPSLAFLTPSFPDREYMQGRIADGAAEAGVPILGTIGTGIAPDHLADALGPDADVRVAGSVETAREDGFQGVFTTHQEAVAHCNAEFPGYLPKTAAFQPPPPLPPKWRPVVPSHFEIMPQAPAADVPQNVPEEVADLPGDAPASEES